MIACLRGEIFEKSGNRVIIMAGGVGYEAHLTDSCFVELPAEGHETTLYIYTYVREDIFALYGFVDLEEKETFLLLIGVSGIGPKLALSILSGISPSELAAALTTEDLARLTAINGIGKKTAERMCLELKDKVAFIVSIDSRPVKEHVAGSDQLIIDAVSALLNLGYQAGDAEKAVHKVIQEESVDQLTIEELVRQALRRLV